MAAPADINIKNLQGKWVLNKNLSDNPDAVLSLQGINWLTRKAIGVATVTQLLKQTPITGDDGKPTNEIIIEQIATGGLKGTTERRVLDYQVRGHSDWLFGTVEGRTRYNTLAALIEENKGKPTEEDVKYLTEGWLPETQEGEVVDAFVENEQSKWTVWQLWGFAKVNDQRMLTRRFVARRTDKEQVVKMKMSYDWIGEL